MATVRLTNGIVISDIDEKTLKAILQGGEDGVHYDSLTRGKIKISDMETPHIKNAVLKMLRGELERAKDSEAFDLVVTFTEGIGTKNPTLVSMIRELDNRSIDF